MDKLNGRVRNPTPFNGHGPVPWAGRPYRNRKPKHPNIIDIGSRRGVRNNGYIEIVNDPSDEEDTVENEVVGSHFHLTEESIKLDFAQRVRE